jgi:hypothetical protein
MRQMVLLFLSLFLSFKAYALDSIEYYIKEYPNQEQEQEQVKVMQAWLEHNRLGSARATAALWRCSNCFTPGKSSKNKPTSSRPYSRPRASRAPSTITLSLCRATIGSSGTRPQSGATWI